MLVELEYSTKRREKKKSREAVGEKPANKRVRTHLIFSRDMERRTGGGGISPEGI